MEQIISLHLTFGREGRGDTQRKAQIGTTLSAAFSHPRKQFAKLFAKRLRHAQHFLNLSLHSLPLLLGRKELQSGYPERSSRCRPRANPQARQVFRRGSKRAIIVSASFFLVEAWASDTRMMHRPEIENTPPVDPRWGSRFQPRPK